MNAPHQTGLIRVRSLLPLTRRGLLGTAAATGALAVLNPSARAATQIDFVGWQNYDRGLKTGDFLQEQDVTLNTTYIGNNDEIIAKLSAGGIGQIDIVTPYMGYIPLMALSGLIDPIDEGLVPNLSKVMQPFRDDPNVIVDGARYGVPFTWGSGPMLYDPAALPTPPEGWNALLDAPLKGKVGMMDDPLGNTMAAALAATDAEVPTRLTRDQLDATVEFLTQMKRQSRLYAASWGELADALARGDIAATFCGWEAMRKFAADKGKEVKIHYPVEGTYAWLDNYCIAKNAPNRETAHALANKILDVDAQVYIGDDLLQGIVNEAAVGQLTAAAKDVYAYDDLDGFAKKAGFFAFPPLEEEGDLMTWNDWQEAYQRFRAA